MRVSMRVFESQKLKTSVSAPNSWITWRQAPQGAVGRGVGVYTATALIERSPAATAEQMAVRSAQVQSP